jgi:SSS family transporter
MLIDLTVVAAYLALAVWGGRRLSHGQATLRDYYLTGRRLPWWAVMGSIVATETSTVTFISVPGYAFGGDLTFLQLALGYLVGRVFVAVVLLPAYFSRDLLSAYQLLAARVGRALGQCAAAVFLLTRNVADGLRLFATAIVLAAMLATAVETVGIEGLSQTAVVVAAILLIAVVTLAYTWLGGMAAVVWMDVVQLAVYLCGALVAAAVLLAGLPEGGREAVAAAQAAGKLTLFDFTWDPGRDYTFWSGVLGGAVFTASTHGTDQMFVQRCLCTRSLAEARLALVASGFFVFFQFAVFLGIGILLWSFYAAGESAALASISAGGAVQADRVFPLFVMTHLPVGLRGLLLAAVVAAAMSTLSSSLNSSAASTVGDFYLAGRRRTETEALRVSRWATGAWAAVQVSVAIAAIGATQRVIDDVLAVQFFSGGLMLGVFLLVLVARPTSGTGIFGLAAGLATIAAVSLLTDLSWQWYVLVGSAATVGAGCLADRVRRTAVFGARG